MEIIKEKNKLNTLLEGKSKALLSVYYTAGFPKLEDTLPIAQELEDAGADLIEIGIPFSDPVPDGPTIQDSNNIALSNGMSLEKLFSQMETLGENVSIPVILMGYLNPAFQYGMERFLKKAKTCGVSGVILPDLPLDIYEKEYQSLFEKLGISMVFLVTPETPEQRIRKIDSLSSTFIYAVSSSSTTGKQQGFSETQTAYLKRLQAMDLQHPLLVGFGISDKNTFDAATKHTAGAIIGSAFIRALEAEGNIKERVRRFMKMVGR